MRNIEPSVYIEIEENPNCPAMAGQVFQPREAGREITHVRVERSGEEQWYEVTGLDQGEQPCPAIAYLIDDSGDGACYLVTGGAWGLRLHSGDSRFGEPYLLLSGDGRDLRFR
jgi:hypothetical protein